MTENADYERGLELRKKLTARRHGRRRNAHRDLAPDLDQFITEVLFGRVWSRPGLELRMRAAVTIGALAALGRQHELKTNIVNGLNAGLTKEEIAEILIHMAFYAGFPAAVSGFEAAREVFDEEGV